jgi:tripartite-type tricarboxylate transporter receptor subunit TctC
VEGNVKAISGVAAALGLLLCSAVSHAQTWPDRPLRLVVPQPAGGGYDLVGRVAADKLTQLLGQSVIVENKTGAGTRAGTDFVAKATADGYTLLVGASPNIVFNPALYKDLPHNTQKDFTPAGVFVNFTYTLVARNDLPQKSLQELVAFAKANPDKITYASGGLGTGQHIAMAVLSHLAGIKTVHVPYRGAQAAYQDVIAGRVDLFFDNVTTARPLVDGGQVRAIATSASKRVPVHPDLPTVRETGVADFVLETWFGIFVHSGTPKPIVDRLRVEMSKIAAMPDVIDRFAKMGATPVNPSVPEMEKMVNDDITIWKKLLTDAGVEG